MLHPSSPRPIGRPRGLFALASLVAIAGVAAALVGAVRGPPAPQDELVRPALFMDFHEEMAGEIYERALDRALSSWDLNARIGPCPEAVRGALCQIVAASADDLAAGRYRAVVVAADAAPVLPHEASGSVPYCRGDEPACAAPGAVPYVALAPLTDRATLDEWFERVGEPLDCDATTCVRLFERAPHPDRPDERAVLSCETGRGAAHRLPRACSLVAIDPSDGLPWALSLLGWGSPEIAARTGLGQPVAASLVATAWRASIVRPGSLQAPDLLRAIGTALADAPFELGINFWPEGGAVQVEGATGFRPSPLFGGAWRESVEILVSSANNPDRPEATHLSTRVHLWVTQQNHPTALRMPTSVQREQYVDAVVDRIRAAVSEVCRADWTLGNELDCTGDGGS